MCPWAWGSEPVFRALRTALEGQVRWRRVYAILFDHDDDPPPPDPAAETAWYARYVADVTGHTGAPRARELSRMPASSWPSSLVAKAAERQGAQVAERVLRRLRETLFVLGEPADTHESALSAALGVPGLDPRRLSADSRSAAVLEEVRADRAEARRPVREVLVAQDGSPHPGTAKETADGGHRYALPTLVVRAPETRRAVPGWRSFEEYATALRAVRPGLSTTVGGLPAHEALERHLSLTDPERRVLADGPWPPPRASRVDTGNGPLWLHPEEAARHPACGRRTPSAP
ncbi:DsbA family protein [Streptomyces fructofermentans]|uniref:DsbA family protein n=1 Tax=Streptomyces fructofermentans TaxID=152141 RepID=UPI00378E1EA4